MNMILFAFSGEMAGVRCRWLTPIIPAPRKQRPEELQFKASSRQIVLKILSQKYPKKG
jgi:hypothetical protein